MNNMSVHQPMAGIKKLLQQNMRCHQQEDTDKIIAFLVGNTEEWDDTRADGGDLELFNCFCELLPSHHIKYMIDEGCKKSKCEEALKTFLQSHHNKNVYDHSTLVFYYCGHGLRKGVVMQDEEIWKYSDIVQTIQQNFQGNKVWCLLDCCYSGAFIQDAIPILKSSPINNNNQNPNDEKTYLCITSTTANVVAFDCTEDQWNLSGPFIRAMRGEVEEKEETEKEKKKKNKRVASTTMTTQDLISDMAYRHAIFDGNKMQCELITTGSYDHLHYIDPLKPFPFMIPKSTTVTTTRTTPPPDNDIKFVTEGSDSCRSVSTLGAQCATLQFFIDGDNDLDDHNYTTRETTSLIGSSSSNSNDDSSNDNAGSESSNSSISSSSSVEGVFKTKDENQWKHLVHLDCGDYVYAKWEGGYPSEMITKNTINGKAEKSTSQYMFPIYYKGIVLTKRKNMYENVNDENSDDEIIEIEFQSPQHPRQQHRVGAEPFKEEQQRELLCWESTCSLSTEVLPYHYFSYDTKEFIDSQLLLANHSRYLDQSSFPVGASVWATYDDRVYSGTVVNPAVPIVHEGRVKDQTLDDIYGPFLWIEWKDEDGDYDLVPRHRCYSIANNDTKSDEGDVKSAASAPTSKLLAGEKPTVNDIFEWNHDLYLQSKHDLTPLECLMKGMKSMGRQLVFGKERREVLCYFDGEWLDALTSCEIPSITVLVSHLHFFLSGNYCVVQWHKKDGTHAVVPESLIRPKARLV